MPTTQSALIVPQSPGSPEDIYSRELLDRFPTTEFLGSSYIIAANKRVLRLESHGHYLQAAVESLHDRLSSCGKVSLIKPKCGDCGHRFPTHEVHLHCFNRYAPCCASIRYRRAFSRLMSFDIPQRKLHHAVIGFPHKPQYHRIHKKREEYIISEFARAMKKAGMPLYGLKVFDFQDKVNEYTHYHLALLPMTLDYRKAQKVRKAVSIRTREPFVFHVMRGHGGLRPKRALFSYFAKRMAGLYGDGQKFIEYTNSAGRIRRLYYAFTLDERMDEKDFIINFSGCRTLAPISKRIACNTRSHLGNKRENLTCPRCYSDFIILDFEPTGLKIVEVPQLAKKSGVLT
jgi:predicted Zn-ribbon and HTH transcriptional regulator